MKKFTTLILASVLLATGLFAQKAPVIGVVDVQGVLAEFTEFQSALEKVRGSVAPVEEEMQKMQASIQTIVTEGREIETKANNPAASLQEAQANLNQFRQQAQAIAQQGQEEQLAPLQARAVEAVKAVAEDKGIDLVLPKNNLIYSSDALEISDAVIAFLNSGE